MKKLILKVKLYRMMRLAYGIKWHKIRKSRRQYYLFLYMDADYKSLHECLYSLSGGDVYCDKGYLWYINYKGEINKTGILDEKRRLKRKKVK